MKAMQSITKLIPVVFFSFALMVASLEVNAQNSRNKDHKSDKNRDRKEYRYDHSNHSDQSFGRNDGHKGNGKYNKGYKSGKNNGNYAYGEHHSSRDYHSKKNYFNHPKYGRVYQKFDYKPTVLRHTHGNYYFSGNQFYTYRDGIGYCVAEPPRQMYFRDLPYNCHRVHVNGNVFFRHGDLYFSHSPRGYVMVPSPLAVSFSVGF